MRNKLFTALGGVALVSVVAFVLLFAAHPSMSDIHALGFLRETSPDVP